MRTINSKRTGLIWKKAGPPSVRPAVEESAPQIGRSQPGSVRPNLVESEEYEWVSAVNMPGLIASPRSAGSAPQKSVVSERHDLGEVVETEDGDTTSVCQLPGGLHIEGAPSMFAAAQPRSGDELQCEDEYSEITAMQMPGGIVSPLTEDCGSKQAASVRGLCTTCIHDANCDFPRPAGGVWRCEEYA
jgi:putative hemolysin